MNRPTSIFVAGVVWPVIWEPGETFETDEFSGPKLGECDYAKGQIRVAGALLEDRAAQVFLHEALHAVSQEHGVDLTEEDINALTAGLFTMLRLSPGVLAYLDRAGRVVSALTITAVPGADPLTLAKQVRDELTRSARQNNGVGI